MGYLEIRKKQKKNVAKSSPNKELDELIKKNNFKPTEYSIEYVNYCLSNYKTLIEETENYYQKEILEKKILLDDALFKKISDYSLEVFNTNKQEYYKRLFVFDFLENKLENSQNKIN